MDNIISVLAESDLRDRIAAQAAESQRANGSNKPEHKVFITNEKS